MVGRLERLEAHAAATRPPPARPVHDHRRRDDPWYLRLARAGVAVWDEERGFWTGHPDPEVRRWLWRYLQERKGRPIGYVREPYVRSES